MFTSHMGFDGFASTGNLQATWPSTLKNDTGQILKEKCNVYSIENYYIHNQMSGFK